MIEVSKQYEPKEAQEKWYRFWEENGYFNANPNPGRSLTSL